MSKYSDLYVNVFESIAIVTTKLLNLNTKGVFLNKPGDPHHLSSVVFT